MLATIKLFTGDALGAAFQAKFNKFIVQAYKLAGFIALTTILLGLFSYFSVHVFYFLNHSWAKPIIVSPTDKQVVDLRSALAQEESQRDNLLTQRFDLDARLEDQNRIIAAEESFQEDYARMLASDIEFRKKMLARLSRVSAAHARAASAIARANNDYAAITRNDAKAMLGAGIITKDDAVRTAQESANLASQNLGLDVKSIELQTEVSTLERDIDALEVADGTLRMATGKVPGAMNHDVLAMKRDFDRSKLDGARARSAKIALEKSITTVDSSLKRYETLMKSITDSPYLRALDRHVALAFVPYDNVDSAKSGAKIYACHANFIFCSKVGRVVDVLPGEVSSKHPTQAVEVRGVLVEIELDEMREAENAILHFGHAPLLL